jgi:hypothetical protein
MIIHHKFESSSDLEHPFLEKCIGQVGLGENHGVVVVVVVLVLVVLVVVMSNYALHL